MLNGKIYAKIFFKSVNIESATRSRAIMIDALIGDVFYIAARPSDLCWNFYRLISFTGFFISS